MILICFRTLYWILKENLNLEIPNLKVRILQVGKIMIMKKEWIQQIILVILKTMNKYMTRSIV